MIEVQIHVLPKETYLPGTPITVRLYDEPKPVGIVDIDGADVFLIDRASCDRLIAAVQQVRAHLPKETP